MRSLHDRSMNLTICSFQRAILVCKAIHRGMNLTICSCGSTFLTSSHCRVGFLMAFSYPLFGEQAQFAFKEGEACFELFSRLRLPCWWRRAPRELRKQLRSRRFRKASRAKPLPVTSRQWPIIVIGITGTTGVIGTVGVPGITGIIVTAGTGGVIGTTVIIGTTGGITGVIGTTGTTGTTGMAIWGTTWDITWGTTWDTIWGTTWGTWDTTWGIIVSGGRGLPLRGMTR